MTQVCPSCNENIEFSNGEAMKFCPLCGGKFVADYIKGVRVGEIGKPNNGRMILVFLLDI